MLAFLRPPAPSPRTQLSHLPTLSVDGSRASIKFSDTSSTGLEKPTITFVLPPALPGPNPLDNSSLIPPLHFHFNQSETFTCVRGALKVVINGQSRVVPAGETLTALPGQYHRFTNASTEEELVVEMWKKPGKLAQEERFLRNLAVYLRDEVTPGESMVSGVGFFQVLLLAWESETVLCETVHILGLPKLVGRPVASIFNWLGAVVIGKWLLDYKGNFEEYHDESSKKVL